MAIINQLAASVRFGPCVRGLTHSFNACVCLSEWCSSLNTADLFELQDVLVRLDAFVKQRDRQTHIQPSPSPCNRQTDRQTDTTEGSSHGVDWTVGRASQSYYALVAVECNCYRACAAQPRLATAAGHTCCCATLSGMPLDHSRSSASSSIVLGLSSSLRLIALNSSHAYSHRRACVYTLCNVDVSQTCDRPLRRCVNLSRRQHLRNALYYRCSAPAVWNSLPQTVLSSDSVAVFKFRLKTFLFSQAFSSFSAH